MICAILIEKIVHSLAARWKQQVVCIDIIMNDLEHGMV